MLTSSTITMRDLVRQCLRYRPDRLILGEVRGTEALDLIFALNTGHGGSFSTIHANSAEDAIARLEDLCSTAAVNVPRRAIATAFQCIAFVRRTAQGRRIEDVLNVSGFDAASGRYLTTSTH
jgi:type IV secretion system protein VirB11